MTRGALPVQPVKFKPMEAVSRGDLERMAAAYLVEAVNRAGRDVPTILSTEARP